MIRRAPFLVTSFGLACHMLLFCVLPPSDGSGRFSRLNLLQLIISVEFLVTVAIFFVLIIKTVRFNRTRPSPDSIETLVHKYDPAISSTSGKYGSLETGFTYVISLSVLLPAVL